MSFWSNFSDFILKITWVKVMLLIVVLVSLVIGYILVPDGITTFLIEKTPPFFPFGITLRDIVILAFALILSLLVYAAVNAVFAVHAWVKKPRPMGHEKVLSIIKEKLNEKEQIALANLALGNLRYNDYYDKDYAINKAMVEYFLELKLITHNEIWLGEYVVDETVRKVIMHSIRTQANNPKPSLVRD